MTDQPTTTTPSQDTEETADDAAHRLAAELEQAHATIATLKQIAQEAAQIIEDVAQGRADDRLGNPNHPYPRWLRARHLAKQAALVAEAGAAIPGRFDHDSDCGCTPPCGHGTYRVAEAAGASVPSPRAQVAVPRPFDPAARVDGARVWLEDADTDGERAEVIADLIRDWLAAAPDGEADPYEALAGELVRLLSGLPGVDHGAEARQLLAAGTLPPSERDYDAEAVEVLLGGVGHAVMHLAEQVGRLVPSAGPDPVAAAGRQLVATWRAYPASGGRSDGYATQIGTAEQALAAAVDVADGRMEDNPLQPEGAPCGHCWACHAQQDTPEAELLEAAIASVADLDRTGETDLDRLSAAVRRLLEAPACVDLLVPPVSIAETAAEDQGDEQPRPSQHNPVTTSYAIDQITDIEQLRRAAHRMWEALVACKEQGEHTFRVAIADATCEPCQAAIDGDPDAVGCDNYRTWQKLIDRGFGSGL